jgi:phage terminase small subunit
VGVLKNSRHEAFAQALAKGKTADEAYQDAGYKPSRGNAARLKANESIRARVAEITSRGADRAEIDVARVLTELSRVGFSDIRRAFDADGRLKRPEQWDDEFAVAVAGVDVVTRNLGEGEVEYVHKLKMWDKNSALDKLARHLSMYNDTLQVNVVDSLAERLSRMKARSRMQRDVDEAPVMAEPRRDPPALSEPPQARSGPEHDEAEPEVETAADLPAHDPILPRKPPVSRVLDWPEPGKSMHETDYDPYPGKD